MAECNRVTPYGDIVASPLRGELLGNRGCIHRERRIVRPWANRRWVACALHYKGWTAPKWAPNRWTALFFYDEAVAFAAGHRPCALCRRADYDRFSAAAGIQRADEIDAVLHEQRVDGRTKRRHRLPWKELPVGTFTEIENGPYLVRADDVIAWDAETGYGVACERPDDGVACVLTPPLAITALRNGYTPKISTTLPR